MHSRQRYSLFTAVIISIFIGGAVSILSIHDLYKYEGALYNSERFSNAMDKTTKFCVFNSGSIIRVFDLEERILLKELKSHDNEVLSIKFSNSGKSFASTGSDHKSFIWDFPSFEAIHELKGHNGWIYSANFSPNSKLLVTASADRTARIWSTDTGSLLFILNHTHRVRNAIFSPDGAIVITYGDESSINIWNVSDGKLLGEVNAPSKVTYIKLLPDSESFVCGGAEGWVCIINLKSLKMIKTMRLVSGEVNFLAISPNGSFLGVSSDRGVAVYDFNKGSIIWSSTDQNQKSFGCEFLTDSYLAYALGGRLDVINFLNGRMEYQKDMPGDRIYQLELSRKTHRLLARTGSNGVVSFLEIRNPGIIGIVVTPQMLIVVCSGVYLLSKLVRSSEFLKRKMLVANRISNE